MIILRKRVKKIIYFFIYFNLVFLLGFFLFFSNDVKALWVNSNMNVSNKEETIGNMKASAWCYGANIYYYDDLIAQGKPNLKVDDIVIKEGKYYKVLINVNGYQQDYDPEYINWGHTMYYSHITKYYDPRNSYVKGDHVYYEDPSGKLYAYEVNKNKSPDTRKPATNEPPDVGNSWWGGGYYTFKGPFLVDEGKTKYYYSYHKLYRVGEMVFPDTGTWRDYYMASMEFLPGNQDSLEPNIGIAPIEGRDSPYWIRVTRYSKYRRLEKDSYIYDESGGKTFFYKVLKDAYWKSVDDTEYFQPYIPPNYDEFM